MQILPLTYPVLVVLVTISALYGDVLAYWHQSALLLGVSPLGTALLWCLDRVRTLASPKLGDKRLAWYPGWRSGAGVVACLGLALIPLGSFFYCISILQNKAFDLSEYVDKTVVVRGYVEDEATVGDGLPCFTLACGAIVFPVRHPLAAQIKVLPGRFSKISIHKGDAGSFELVIKHAGNGSRVPAFAYGGQVWLSPTSIDGRKAQATVWLDDVLAGLRKTMVEMHERNLGHDLGDLLASMVLGDKAVKINDGVVKSFRNVGLAHVLAASGFNLTVVTAMTYFICRLFVRSRLIVHIVCALNTICYVGLAGASPSVMRSAIMCGVLLAIGLTGLRAHLLSVLSIALLISIAQDPSCVSDVGLQLSYVATASLIFVGSSLSRLFCGDSKGLRRFFGETIAVVLISQSAVLPIQLLCFSQVGMMFLPANLLITPILAPLTIVGFASSALYPALCRLPYVGALADPIAWAIDWTAIWPLRLMLVAVNYMASIDIAILRLGAPTFAGVVAYVFSWFALACCLRVRTGRTFAAGLFLIALTFMLWRPPLNKPMVACFSQAIVFVSTNRQATFLSLSQSPNVNRAVTKWCLTNGFTLSHETQPEQVQPATAIFDAPGLTVVCVNVNELHNVGALANICNRANRIVLVLVRKGYGKRCSDDSWQQCIEAVKPDFIASVYVRSRGRANQSVRNDEKSSLADLDAPFQLCTEDPAVSASSKRLTSPSRWR